MSEGKKERGSKPRWTAENCIQALEAFIEREGRSPATVEMNAKFGLPSYLTFYNQVGYSHIKYCDDHGIVHYRSGRPRIWNDERCKEAIDRFVQEKGRLPKILYEAKPKFGLPTSVTFYHCTGEKMGEYLRKTYPELPERNMNANAIWTKERIDAAADRFWETHGRHPTPREYDLEHGLPSRNTFTAHFGISAGTYWEKRYPVPPKWSTDQIKMAFNNFIEQNSRLPWLKELRPENDLPRLNHILSRTGMSTYSDFCREYFPSVPPSRRIWNKERCIQAVDQFIQQHGRCPRTDDFRRKTRLPPQASFRRYVGQSAFMYCKQNYPQLLILPCRWTKELCTQAVDRFVAQTGRLPRSKEYTSDNGLPTWVTFQRQVGETGLQYYSRQYPKMRQAIKWTPSRICEALDSFVEENGRPPRTNELSKKNQLPCYECFQKTVDTTPGAFLRERYPEYYENPDQKQDMSWGMQMM